MRRSRREVLTAAAALGMSPLFSKLAEAGLPAGIKLGPSASFSFDRLRSEARMLASQAYRAPPVIAPDILQKLDYDAVWKIVYRPEMTVYGENPRSPGIRFFHMHRYVKDPVRIFLVEKDSAQEILYSPSYFDMPADSPAHALPKEAGFAGFRVLSESAKGDWLAFQGVSYFRSSGALDQYGLSARGLAIDTASPGPEEFPRFTAFWLELDRDNGLTIYAMLDSPSMTGAYRMVTTRNDQGVFHVVDCSLFARKAVDRLGIAPLTSMFWYAESATGWPRDWRPEIHDTDGLSMITGWGEHIWRPLNNPPWIMTNSFSDENPKGFGLLQRDRNFADYQDDGVFYDRRPSLWVEPMGQWGKGQVMLVELPTDDEIHDNIVAFWKPADPVKQGDSYDFRYKLHWVAKEPFPTPAGRVVATRLGVGGVPGQPRPPGAFKIAIDFQGAKFAGLTRESGAVATVSASRGSVSNIQSFPVVGTELWRVIFDIAVSGRDPVDLRAYVKKGDEPLSETWLYQIFPEAIGAKAGP